MAGDGLRWRAEQRPRHLCVRSADIGRPPLSVQQLLQRARRGTWAPRRGVSYGRQRTSRWSALAERLPSRSACTRVVTTKHRKHR